MRERGPGGVRVSLAATIEAEESSGSGSTVLALQSCHEKKGSTVLAHLFNAVPDLMGVFRV